MFGDTSWTVLFFSTISDLACSLWCTVPAVDCIQCHVILLYELESGNAVNSWFNPKIKETPDYSVIHVSLVSALPLRHFILVLITVIDQEKRFAFGLTTFQPSAEQKFITHLNRFIIVLQLKIFLIYPSAQTSSFSVLKACFIIWSWSCEMQWAHQ